MEEDKLSVEEFEDLFGNTPFENIKKIRKYINENYIPKSKVQEKIEEQYERDWIFNEVRDEIIETLQELLED